MVLDGRGVAWLHHSLIADELTRGEPVEAASANWHVELDVSLFRDIAPIGSASENFWATVRGYKKGNSRHLAVRRSGSSVVRWPNSARPP